MNDEKGQSPFRPQANLERDRILGLSFYRLSRPQLLSCFEEALRNGKQSRFAYLNIAVVNQAFHNRQLSTLLNETELVYIDGAGISWGLRVLGKEPTPRHTGADFFPDVMRLCAEGGWRVGFLGGHPGSAEKIAEIYRDRFPNLEVTFIRDGFTEAKDEARVEEDLTKDPPDLLLVGMGVPHQEYWIRDHYKKFEIGVYWSVGALFEYDGGSLRRCPAWMGRAGLEWLYRLYCEPGRLWKRYLIGNPLFLLRCLSSRLRGREGTS
ncbi:MAG: WecB/TagA/CpsF family glycosyltransferase [Candidatus Omnitrophica bacterium]|nr:WecB/TagA/CpsF family glycosyltransferase [Candidatus Omnitrophota bacterium]